MAETTIQPGSEVLVVDAFGVRKPRRAVTGVVDGGDFPVVWVCSDDEWVTARDEGRDPDGVPWPAEDVTPLVSA